MYRSGDAGRFDERGYFAFIEKHDSAVDFMAMDESSISPAENRFRVDAEPGGKWPRFAEFAYTCSIMDSSRCSRGRLLVHWCFPIGTSISRVHATF
jgi:hypothetical protein